MTRNARIVGLLALAAVLTAFVLIALVRAPSDRNVDAPAVVASGVVLRDEPSIEAERLQSESSAVDATTIRNPVESAEGSQSRPTSPGARDFIVEVRGPSDEPAANVAVALARDKTLLAHARTNSEGLARLQSLEPPLDLYVVSDWVLCRKERLDDVRDRHVVRLIDTAVLHGTVLIDGAEPRESQRFTIGTPYDAQTMQAAPAFLWSALEKCPPFYGQLLEAEDHPFFGLQLGCCTDERGRFAVYGLRPNWKGTLEFGGPYLMESGEGEIAIEDVRKPVLVRFRTPAAITGRAVSAETREPVVGVDGTCVLECADSSGGSPLEFVGDGRFRIPLRCRGTIHARISLAASNARRVLDLPDVPAEGLDLGDVELEAAHEVWVAVHDASGDPIDGVTVSVVDDAAVEDATGDDGRVVLSGVLPSSTELLVSAIGYIDRKCVFQTASATERHPFEVVLQAAPALDVEVHVPDGQSARGLVLDVVSWDLQPLDAIAGVARRFDRNGVEGARGHSIRVSESARDGMVWILRAKLDSSGHLRVNEFMPRKRAVVRLLDAAGVLLDEREVVPELLESGGKIEFTLAAAPGTLIFDVVDADGRPLVAASVVPAGTDVPGDTSATLAYSDADGRAVVPSICARTMDVEVRRNGFATVALIGIAIDAPIVRQRVVMERGLKVEVCTIDPRGRPMRVETIVARLGGTKLSLGDATESESCRKLYDLPAEPVEFVAKLGGRTFRATHDARVSTAAIEVPDAGSMRVELPARSDPPRFRRLRIRDESDPSIVVNQYITANQTDALVDVPVVFPGSYSIELEEFDAEDRSSGRVVARAENVTVRANEWSTVRLTKP